MWRSLAILALFAPCFAGAQNFLWEVSSSSNRVYLFGTMHVGKADWYPLPPSVVDAFAQSHWLAVEADLTDQAAMAKSSEAMTYKPPDSLVNHVPKPQLSRFELLAHNYGLPEAAALQLKPFMALSLLVFSAWAHEGYLPTYGVDAYLIAMAHGEAKPVVELEGVAEQTKLIDSFTDAQVSVLFASTIDAVEHGLVAQQIQELVHAWQIGDSKLMLEAARRYDEQVPGAADIEDKLVWSRNAAIEQRIKGWLDGPKDPRFVAIGALHLVGPRGLVEALRRRGYSVRQVFVAPRMEEGDGH